MCIIVAYCIYVSTRVVVDICGDLACNVMICLGLYVFFFNDTATTEIYTGLIVGSVRCVLGTVIPVVKVLCFPCFFCSMRGRSVGGLFYTSPSPRDS